MRAIGLEKPDFQFDRADHSLIIGAGLAGCATARALAAAGMKCTVFDAHDKLAMAASAVPMAIFRPLATAPSVEQRYFLAAYLELLQELKNLSLTPEVTGLVALSRATDAQRHKAPWQPLSASEASEITGSEIDCPGLYLPAAGAINPARLCRRWLSHENISLHTNTCIGSLREHAGDWQVLDTTGTVVGRGQVVVLANATAAARFTDGVPLIPVSGQISLFSRDHNLPMRSPAICDRGYVIPTQSGLWSGATFHRHVSSATIREEDTRKNLQFCRRFYATDSTPLHSWSGLRCTTPDRMPLIGPLTQTDFAHNAYRDLHHGRRHQRFPKALYRRGVYAFLGLGSRGVVQALYGGKCLADIIFGGNLCDEATRLAVHPARFLMNEMRRRPV